MEKATGFSTNSNAPHDISSRFHTFYLLDSQSEAWKQFLTPVDLRIKPSSHDMEFGGDSRSSDREPLMTRMQWQRRVREAEIAVEALEKQHGRALPIWRENLRLMKANPPKEFVPPERLGFMVRMMSLFLPSAQSRLDQVILRDWKAGYPPQLPPSRGAPSRPENVDAIPRVIGST